MSTMIVTCKVGICSEETLAILGGRGDNLLRTTPSPITLSLLLDLLPNILDREPLPPAV